jgi:cytochrome P450
VRATIDPKLLLDADVVEDPYPFYRRLREEAPVWHVPDTEVFLVTSYDLVAEATGRVEDLSSNIRALLYRDGDGLPQRLPFGEDASQSLATADPPDHGVHRGAVFPDLVAKRMDELEPEIAEVTSGCIDAALQAGAVEFMDAIGNVVPITIVSRLIGFRDSDPAQLLDTAFASTSILGGRLSLDDLSALVDRISVTAAWVDGQLAAAVEQPNDDILGSMVRAVQAGAFGLPEATTMLMTLLSAGGESTTSLLGNAVRMLGEHPDLQDQLRADPSLVPNVVEEALRLESPFRYLFRSTPRATSLGGVDIPEDASVLLMWGAANRDPAEFERPDEIDLHRAVPRRHVAFGRGIHHCVGAPLARLEARVVLSQLLARTERITLDPARPPRWVDSLQVRRHEQLAVLLDGR